MAGQAVAVGGPGVVTVRPKVGVTYVTFTGKLSSTRPLPNCPGVPPSSVTVSVGAYVPDVAYVWAAVIVPDPFDSVAVAGDGGVPSPQSIWPSPAGPTGRPVRVGVAVARVMGRTPGPCYTMSLPFGTPFTALYMGLTSN